VIAGASRLYAARTFTITGCVMVCGFKGDVSRDEVFEADPRSSPSPLPAGLAEFLAAP
jgi:hypothetical protein